MGKIYILLDWYGQSLSNQSSVYNELWKLSANEL